MPFVPAPNIVMCEMRATVDGQKVENRMMVNVLHTPTTGDLNTLNGLFHSFIDDIYNQFCHPGVLWTEVVSTDMGASDGEQISESVGTAGTATGVAVPNETSFCLSLHSTSRGRSARGRFFVLPFTYQFVDPPNKVLSTFAANWVADLETLLGQIVTAGYEPTIVSYRSDNAPRVGGPVYFTITSVVATDLVLDSQRKRKPGVGS